MSDTPTGENEEQVAEEATIKATESHDNYDDDYDSGHDDFDDDDFEEVETTLYRVVVREEEEVIDGRIEAVDKAKAISVESGQSVLVERVDGRVKMNFRDGALIDYVLETRKGRRI